MPSIISKAHKNNLKQAYHHKSSKPPGRRLQETMDKVILHILSGDSVVDAARKEGRAVTTVYTWCRRWPSYRAKLVRAQASRDGKHVVVPRDFDAKWREEYFGRIYKSKPVTPKHLQAGLDLIASLQGGERGIILMPPNHAKTSLVEDWICWHIAHNPEIRVVIVSKTEDHAARVVGRVMERLTDSEVYELFHEDYGPFKPEVRGKPWRDTHFKVLKATGGERDYTCVGMGYKGQVTGRRIDLLVLDDVVDWDNCSPGDVLKQKEFIFSVADSRLDDDSKLLVIGTRFGERDLYRTLLDLDFFDRQLILAAQDEDGRYLWPERHSPSWYEKKKLDPKSWALTYQQYDYSTDGVTFPMEMIEPCFDSAYRSNEIPDGFTTVLGLDPSVEKHTAGVVMGINPRTSQRVLLAADNPYGLTAEGGDNLAGVVEFILNKVETYRCRLLVLEANSGFRFVAKDSKLRSGLVELGCEMQPVEKGKYHSDNEIALTLTALFSNEWVRIPDWLSSRKAYSSLINELMAWHPGDKKLKRDLVQAFYYAEWGCQQMIRKNNSDKPPTADSDVPDWMIDVA